MRQKGEAGAIFILQIFLDAYAGEWRIAPVHLASAAFQLRFNQTQTIVAITFLRVRVGATLVRRPNAA